MRQGISACYECTPKTPVEKTYPVCTIRNTPSKPIHCIVWAKEKFQELFSGIALEEVSEKDTENELPPEGESVLTEDGEIKKEEASLESEKANGFKQWLFRKV